MKIRLLPLVLLAACGGGGDDDVQVDAPPDVPAMIMVTGTAKEVSTSTNPAPGVMVGAFSNADENTPVATATTDANGNYTLMITTNGKALDGFVKGTKAGLLDTYLYAPAPLSADFAGASINMVSANTYSLLADTLCGGQSDPAMGGIAVQVNDAAGMTVGGAMISSTPTASKYCYNKAGGTLPDRNATVTNTDGIGYMINVTGDVTVSATKTGATFKSHKVKARPGTLTTTIISQ